jgi:hypothetical protein
MVSDSSESITIGHDVLALQLSVTGWRISPKWRTMQIQIMDVRDEQGRISIWSSFRLFLFHRSGELVYLLVSLGIRVCDRSIFKLGRSETSDVRDREKGWGSERVTADLPLERGAESVFYFIVYCF